MKNLFTQSGESSLDPNIKTFKDLVKVSIEKYEKHNIINLMRSEPWQSNIFFKKYISYDEIKWNPKVKS